jgi:hypothetical protein
MPASLSSVLKGMATFREAHLGKELVRERGLFGCGSAPYLYTITDPSPSSLDVLSSHDCAYGQERVLSCVGGMCIPDSLLAPVSSQIKPPQLMDSFGDFFKLINKRSSSTDLGDSRGAAATTPGVTAPLPPPPLASVPAPAPTARAPSPFNSPAHSSVDALLHLAPPVASELPVQQAVETGAVVDLQEGGEEEYHGLAVSSNRFRFSPPNDLPFPQLPCTAVAKYPSEPNPATRRIIAISDKYISYAIKDGPIRVINRVKEQPMIVMGFLDHHVSPSP